MSLAGIPIGVMELAKISGTQDSIRLEVTDQRQRKIIASVIERYKLNPSVDILTSEGAVFSDAQNRKIGVCHGELRGNLIHTGKPYADIMVVGSKDGLLLGWISSDKMSDANDRFLVPAKALNAMPSKFDFCQPCPHMSVYGGFLAIEENHWWCFGCDTIIPFIG